MKYLFLVIAFLSCKSGAEKVTDRHMESDTVPQLSARHDTSTMDQPDPYQAGTDTHLVNEAMDKIFKFPEVQAVNKQITKKSKGSHGIAILVRDEFDGDSAYYHFEVGDNSNEDRYVNIFDFLLEKKTGQIKVYEQAADTIVSLTYWRKTKN